jgi:hypothetical protein
MHTWAARVAAQTSNQRKETLMLNWHHEDLILYIFLILPLLVATGMLVVGAFRDYRRADELLHKRNTRDSE